jgi:hypothetical protein
MNPTLFFNAAIEIARVANNILVLVNSEANEEIIRTHFNYIGKIAAINAAKPEIQGYSERD